MLRERGFALFGECLCGRASSLQELAALSGDCRFPVGSKVRTHSLAAAEYNNLVGTVSGGATVKNGVRRVPITLEINKDVRQIIALKEDNLTAVDRESDPLCHVDTNLHDSLVVKGYFGLFSLINDNPLLPTDADAGRNILGEVFSQQEKMDPDSCPHTQYLLGECYEYGITDMLPRDTTKAIEWYRLAAAQGHAGAQCELGYCYHTGESVDQDQVTGVKYYQQAADQGYAKAQYYIGVAYYYGQGVETDTDDPEDFPAAVKWYQLAADQGYAAAQSTLGFCLQVGKGCNLDIAGAEKYFRLAAEQGDTYASAKLGTLKDFLAT